MTYPAILNLVGLICDYNQLSYLDITHNPDLRQLSIGGMPSLYQVCVLEMPFPPYNFLIEKQGSPNVYFADCKAPELVAASEILYQAGYIEATSTEDGMIYLVSGNTEQYLDLIRVQSIDSVEAIANIPATISLAGLENGSYCLYARDHYGNISEQVTFITEGLGIKSFGEEQIQIYPNPVNDLLSILLLRPGEYSIVITSINGQIIYEKQSSGSSYLIDLSSYQPGFYIITVRSMDLVAKRKIIKR